MLYSVLKGKIFFGAVRDSVFKKSLHQSHLIGRRPNTNPNLRFACRINIQL